MCPQQDSFPVIKTGYRRPTGSLDKQDASKVKFTTHLRNSLLVYHSPLLLHVAFTLTKKGGKYYIRLKLDSRNLSGKYRFL